MTSCHRIRCLSWNPLLCIKPSVTTIFFAIVQRLKFLMQYFLKWYNQVQSYFWRYWHLLRDTGIITQLAVWATGIRHTRNRHPVAICYPLVCKERFVLVKSDCRYPLQLIHKCCGSNIGNVRYIQTEKFVIEVAYRETRLPFWDAQISRYRRQMTNGEAVILRSVVQIRLARWGYFFRIIVQTCAFEVVWIISNNHLPNKNYTQSNTTHSRSSGYDKKTIYMN